MAHDEIREPALRTLLEAVPPDCWHDSWYGSRAITDELPSDWLEHHTPADRASWMTLYEALHRELRDGLTQKGAALLDPIFGAMARHMNRRDFDSPAAKAVNAMSRALDSRVHGWDYWPSQSAGSTGEDWWEERG